VGLEGLQTLDGRVIWNGGGIGEEEGGTKFKFLLGLTFCMVGEIKLEDVTNFEFCYRTIGKIPIFLSFFSLKYILMDLVHLIN
jgi:hypothetical protein